MSEDKGTLLVVDDEKDIAQLLCALISNAGYRVYAAYDGEKALSMVRALLPDLILLDIMMPGMDGKQLKAALNEDKVLADIPVIFLSARQSTQDKVEGLELKAEDYMTKPFDQKELLARIESVLNRRRRYRIMSMRDELTGLLNALGFQKQLSLFFHIAKRYRRPFSVALVTLDELKGVKGVLGHATRDLILRAMAEAMENIFRKSEIIARCGEDEFAIIFPESTEDQTRVALLRLKNDLDHKTFFSAHTHKEFTIAIRAGVAGAQDSVKDEAALLAMARRDMPPARVLEKHGEDGFARDE